MKIRAILTITVAEFVIISSLTAFGQQGKKTVKEKKNVANAMKIDLLPA